MKAVIPAAGLGTRFLPLTKTSPKEMLPLVDKPAIHYVVQEAIQAGIDDILIITGRGKRSIEDYFDKSFELEYFLQKKNDNQKLQEIQEISEMADIHYIRQKEPRGLGHAILCARKHVDAEPFAVLLGDDVIVSKVPCILQLMHHFQKHETTILAVEHLPQNVLHRYGVIRYSSQRDQLYEVQDLIEKPSLGKAPSDLATIGRYILSPKIFDCLLKTPPGHNDEIQLTDALNLLRQQEPIYAYEFQGKRYDLGNKVGWLKTLIDFALERDEFKDELISHIKQYKNI
ncbi:MAG: UTP--glucose-1-phosphate uridylyltransferase GalU [Candidatus Aminicenantes bacterium]|nr:UTP--glucose-1-phosphate uridylyltransferase GalU [Candidatus Aminicenantes bacterium]